jgi:hypothetical protein
VLPIGSPNESKSSVNVEHGNEIAEEQKGVNVRAQQEQQEEKNGIAEEAEDEEEVAAAEAELQDPSAPPETADALAEQQLELFMNILRTEYRERNYHGVILSQLMKGEPWFRAPNPNKEAVPEGVYSAKEFRNIVKSVADARQYLWIDLYVHLPTLEFK